MIQVISKKGAFNEKCEREFGENPKINNKRKGGVLAKVKVKYTTHLKVKMVVRGVPKDLPAIVFHEAEGRFRDGTTGHYVALKEASYSGKRRLIMVAYDIKDDVVEIITVHPIGGRQVEARINSGRWIRVG